jgi:hypothetical protein
MQESPSIHLCQPDAGKSCGACCGLYNWADSGRESLVERLRGRTRRFQQMVRGPADLPSFSEATRSAEDQTKRYEEIYCCEYVGFLDEDEKRVGCLLHPLRNGGADMRDVSFYGRELCAGHLCPSYHYISDAEKQALLYVLDDWYLYGLCLTDIDLVKNYFRLISEAVYEMPSPVRFKDGILRETARRFFSFKVAWPFRSAAANRFGKYYFDGSQYMISHIDYDALGCGRSRFDAIFVSLSSEFRAGEEVRRAEDMIQAGIDAFVQSYQAAALPPQPAGG